MNLIYKNKINKTKAMFKNTGFFVISFVFIMSIFVGFGANEIVSGGGGVAICSASVDVTPAPEPPTCSISASSSSIVEGESSTLSWSSSNADIAEIDQSIGSVSTDDSTTVSPSSETTYTLTVEGEGGVNTCSVTIGMLTGGGLPSRADVDVYNSPSEQPLASVYLSQVPYTGIDFGDFQTIFFLLGLVIWSFIIAHIFINKGLGEYLVRKINNLSIFSFIKKEYEFFKDYELKPIEGNDRSLVYGESYYNNLEDRNTTDDAFVKKTKNKDTEFFVKKGDSFVSIKEKFLKAFSENNSKDALFCLNQIKSDEEARDFVISIIEVLDSEYRKRIGAGGSVLKPKFVKLLSNLEGSEIERMIETLTFVLDGAYASSLTPLKIAILKFFNENNKEINIYG